MIQNPLHRNNNQKVSRARSRKVEGSKNTPHREVTWKLIPKRKRSLKKPKTRNQTVKTQNQRQSIITKINNPPNSRIHTKTPTTKTSQKKWKSNTLNLSQNPYYPWRA